MPTRTRTRTRTRRTTTTTTTAAEKEDQRRPDVKITQTTKCQLLHTTSHFADCACAPKSVVNASVVSSSFVPNSVTAAANAFRISS